MSVNKVEMVIYGYVVDATVGFQLKEAGKTHIPYYKAQDALNTFGILSNGMNGEYAIIGKVLAIGDEYEGFPLTSFAPHDLIGLDNEVKQGYTNIVGSEPEKLPKLIVLTHWS